MTKMTPVTPVPPSEATPLILDLISRLYTARMMKSSAVSMEKEVMEQFGLKSSLSNLCDHYQVNNSKISIGDYLIKRTPGTTRTIKADLLMARGVSPDIIAECTTETSYYKYDIEYINEAKENNQCSLPLNEETSVPSFPS